MGISNAPPPFLEPVPPPPEGVLRFFTNRLGGVSPGPLASLNLGSNVGDHPDYVSENRRRLLTALGFPSEALQRVRQVHGRETVIVSTPLHEPPPEADALVTDRPGLILGILTADCAPVLLVDPNARVIGAAHAGWRGALGGVLESCLDAMTRLGAQPDRILTLTGPCIRQPAFEVGQDVRDQFLLQSWENQRFFLPKLTDAAFDAGRGEKYLLDLTGYLHHRLALAGVPSAGMDDLMTCTHTHEARFFSHRRASQRSEVPCGRHLGGIALLE